MHVSYSMAETAGTIAINQSPPYWDATVNQPEILLNNRLSHDSDCSDNSFIYVHTIHGHCVLVYVIALWNWSQVKIVILCLVSM